MIMQKAFSFYGVHSTSAGPNSWSMASVPVNRLSMVILRLNMKTTNGHM